jgi:kojibiose phosphorylase
LSQSVRERVSVIAPFPVFCDEAWRLVAEGFDLAREHETESLFAVANAYVGTRASLFEGTSLSAPATYVAGVFTRSEAPGSVPELAIAPDWTRMLVSVENRELRLETSGKLEHRRILDLRQGVLWREWRHCDALGRITSLRELRLASLADRRLLFQSVEITPENYSGRLRIECWVAQGPDEARLQTENPARLVPATAASDLRSSGRDSVVLSFRTPDDRYQVALATRSILEAEEGRQPVPEVDLHAGELVSRWQVDAQIGLTWRLNRFVTLHTSRESDRPGEAARSHVNRVLEQDVRTILLGHAASWEERWRAADVIVEGDEAAQRAIRFAVYHLIAAANPDDEHVSIGARSLTGGAYKGHVFWDTEIYMLPFFIFTQPEAARALLMYRYHTLPAARRNARTLGWRGALYAWESADTGEETTPRSVIAPNGEVIEILNGEQENHISADVAYAVWQYWTAAEDEAFFRRAGAEILIETARFWASRGDMGEDGRYHIRRVIGPDEYHDNVDDNAYTNVMAQWNLERGAEATRLLQERWPETWRELVDRLALASDEPARWSELASAMYTGFDPSTGLFEQFRGYFDLEEIDLAAYEPRTVPMDILLGRERTRSSQVVKQPDVVLLLYLLWDRFPPEVREANFHYYEPRCGHGSSLSPSIHALVAARLNDLELAQRYFVQAAEIDLADNMGNAASGVHAAGLGGLWQAAVFGFGGLQFGPEGPILDPHLPANWRRLAVTVRWRGKTTALSGGQREVKR